MTYQEKAENFGELVCDNLNWLACVPTHSQVIAGTIFPGWHIQRDTIVEGAQRAGHWGRLALGQRDT